MTNAWGVLCVRSLLVVRSFYVLSHSYRRPHAKEKAKEAFFIPIGNLPEIELGRKDRDVKYFELSFASFDRYFDTASSFLSQ